MRPSAGTFNGQPIAWWVVPGSVCYLVDAEGHNLHINDLPFGHDILHIGDEGEDLWMFERFGPHPNERGYCTAGSDSGTLKQMQELFLLDLKTLELQESKIMRSKDVKIGMLCETVVDDGQTVVVRITSEAKGGGWNAINTTNDKKVKIKNPRDLAPMVSSAAPQENEEEQEDGEDQEVDGGGEVADTTAETPIPKPRKTKSGAMTGVDAAAKILFDHGQPMGCQEIVAKAAEDGLWNPAGKTPAATLYSAILREITLKGDQSRFTKVSRGQFSIKA